MTSSFLTVATHSGTFHADDVFACALLRLAHNDQVVLQRSRDMAVIEAADVVFDVGGIYDPSCRRYDHHMRDKPLRENGEPYSSAGLVWRDFGGQVLSALLPAVTESMRNAIQRKIHDGLIRDVDLMDNGAMTPQVGHFSAVIELFNNTFVETERDENAAFDQAAEMASHVIRRAIAKASAAVMAEDQVAAAAAAASDPRIIVLETRLPWDDAVFELDLSTALYVVRPAGRDWTCSAIPPERGSFAQRKSLPEAWGGLRDQDLARLTGVQDATFCHPARFVCGAVSREGALRLAELAADA